MNVNIKKGIAKGFIDAPPSKSMAHRMLICAGLSNGVSTIKGISRSMDVLATIDCLEAIGAKCEISNDTATVTGVDILTSKSNKILKCRESGSTLRFFIPICLITGESMVLSGSEGLLKRPLDVYKNLCDEQNLNFSQNANSCIVKGPLKAGNFKIPGNISSQFISGLLFALPLLNKDSTLTITPPIESRSYIEMTISALSYFGVTAVWKDENTIYIKGNQRYTPKEANVEGDYSNAAFFEALNTLGSNIKIGNLLPDSIQGDKIYTQMFEQLSIGTPTLNITDCPDLGPILFAVAAAKNGGVFTGTRRLKIKESNRAEVMATELRKFGTAVTNYEDEVVIYPAEFHAPSQNLYGHNDHRIVMALSVLLTLTGGNIEGADAVSKSFPDFFEKLKKLNIEVTEYDQ